MKKTIVGVILFFLLAFAPATIYGQDLPVPDGGFEVWEPEFVESSLEGSSWEPDGDFVYIWKIGNFQVHFFDGEWKVRSYPNLDIRFDEYKFEEANGLWGYSGGRWMTRSRAYVVNSWAYVSEPTNYSWHDSYEVQIIIPPTGEFDLARADAVMEALGWSKYGPWVVCRDAHVDNRFDGPKEWFELCVAGSFESPYSFSNLYSQGLQPFDPFILQGGWYEGAALLNPDLWELDWPGWSVEVCKGTQYVLTPVGIVDINSINNRHFRDYVPENGFAIFDYTDDFFSINDMRQLHVGSVRVIECPHPAGGEWKWYGLPGG